MRIVAAAAVLVAAAFGGAAQTQESPPADEPMPPQTRPRPSGQWYGWQTGLADAAALGMLIAAASGAPRGFTNAGLATFVLAPPIIHFAHDRSGPGFGSAGVRVSAPLLGLFAGLVLAAGSGACEQDQSRDAHLPLPGRCQVGFAEAGLFGGMALASLLDLVTARMDPVAGDWQPDRHPGTAWLPVVAPSQAGTTVGVVGRF